MRTSRPTQIYAGRHPRLAAIDAATHPAAMLERSEHPSTKATVGDAEQLSPMLAADTEDDDE